MVFTKSIKLPQGFIVRYDGFSEPTRKVFYFNLSSSILIRMFEKCGEVMKVNFTKLVIFMISHSQLNLPLKCYC